MAAQHPSYAGLASMVKLHPQLVTQIVGNALTAIGITSPQLGRFRRCRHGHLPEDIYIGPGIGDGQGPCSRVT